MYPAKQTKSELDPVISSLIASRTINVNTGMQTPSPDVTFKLLRIKTQY